MSGAVANAFDSTLWGEQPQNRKRRINCSNVSGFVPRRAADANNDDDDCD